MNSLTIAFLIVLYIACGIVTSLFMFMMYAMAFSAHWPGCYFCMAFQIVTPICFWPLWFVWWQWKSSTASARDAVDNHEEDAMI
jgi:hypothetical protein